MMISSPPTNRNANAYPKPAVALKHSGATIHTQNQSLSTPPSASPPSVKFGGNPITKAWNAVWNAIKKGIQNLIVILFGVPFWLMLIKGAELHAKDFMKARKANQEQKP